MGLGGPVVYGICGGLHARGPVLEWRASGTPACGVGPARFRVGWAYLVLYPRWACSAMHMLLVPKFGPLFLQPEKQNPLQEKNRSMVHEIGIQSCITAHIVSLKKTEHIACTNNFLWKYKKIKRVLFLLNGKRGLKGPRYCILIIVGEVQTIKRTFQKRKFSNVAANSCTEEPRIRICIPGQLAHDVSHDGEKAF
jgi:hypothetical protein